MLTGGYRFACKADDLAVAAQRFALGNVSSRYLVPSRHRLKHKNAFCGQVQAFGKGLPSN
jgi:hypothetical protein